MLESLESKLFLVFMAGFGVSTFLAYLIFGRYITFLEKIQDMFVEFKAEGHKGKWLK